MAIHTLNGPHGPAWHLATPTTSWLLAIGPLGHLELLHWGPTLGQASDVDVAALTPQWPYTPGVVVVADEAAAPTYSLGRTTLAWSGPGKGDYREPGVEVAGENVVDLRYVRHEVLEGVVGAPAPLPSCDGDDDTATLVVTLADEVLGLECDLVFTVAAAHDVVVRRTVLRNVCDVARTVTRLAAFVADVPGVGLEAITLDGEWLREAHPHRRALEPGTVSIGSVTGGSSAEHNPGVVVCERGATETHGRAWATNLVWSGNHRTALELSWTQTLRWVVGEHPQGFAWELAPGDELSSPEAVTAYSAGGLGGLSTTLHRFVDDCVVPAAWRRRERPVLFNSWEGSYFSFDHGRVVEMARAAAGLGAELFVLDDGWFGHRDDDTTSLGDWTAHAGKLPDGLAALAEEVVGLDVGFGLWFEPEAVSPDSDLYRAHPDWAVRVPGREPSLARHELLLDLCNPDVRDHLVEVLGGVLDSAPISYVKWDMNRKHSDAGSPTCPAGEFHRRWTLGLYDVLARVFGPRPEVLLETCSSGGNRFDLGMLAFGPQIWASDCTDPVERQDIQTGLSLLYPPSTMGAHVAASPSHQTARHTPLETRFAVAAFGALGYELDPTALSDDDAAAIREQIAWYKERRATFQFGRFRRLEPPQGFLRQWVVDDDARAIAVHHRRLVPAADLGHRLVVPGLGAERPYLVTIRGEGGTTSAAELAGVPLQFPASGSLLAAGLSLPLEMGDHVSHLVDIAPLG